MQKIAQINSPSYYPDTGYNMDSAFRSHQGPLLPVQYINSPILLFKIEDSQGSNLLITSSESYSGDALKRLLQLARLITEGWASSITMAIHDYYDYSHGSEARTIVSQLQDDSFRKQIKIVALNYSDFRDLGGVSHV